MVTRLAILLSFVVAVPSGLSANATVPPSTTDAPAMDARVVLRAYSELVDQEIQNTRDALRILAASENAKSGDWGRIKEPLLLLAESTPDSAAVWFAHPDGSYFTTTTGLTDQNLEDRSYFPTLMDGEEVIGELVVSKSTGKRSTIIAVPVRSNGRVVGALGVSMAMEKVAATLEEEIGLPPQVSFFALDSHGETALHRDASLLFEFPNRLGSPTLTGAVTEMLSKPEGIVRYVFEGAQRTAIFKRSEITGWIYALRW